MEQIGPMLETEEFLPGFEPCTMDRNEKRSRQSRGNVGFNRLTLAFSFEELWSSL
jgi:hypothetical protein